MLQKIKNALAMFFKERWCLMLQKIKNALAKARIGLAISLLALKNWLCSLNNLVFILPGFALIIVFFMILCSNSGTVTRLVIGLVCLMAGSGIATFGLGRITGKYRVPPSPDLGDLYERMRARIRDNEHQHTCPECSDSPSREDGLLS